MVLALGRARAPRLAVLGTAAAGTRRTVRQGADLAGAHQPDAAPFAWTAPQEFPAGQQDATATGKAPHTSKEAQRIFDHVHSREADPWHYTTSWYERRKRALTVAALPEEHYASGLEIGCSIGTLTADLAARCTNLLAVDASGTALERAAGRLAPLPGVAARQLTLPGEWPDGSYDLVVMSEVGYYLAAYELEVLLERIRESVVPGGTLVLCHWRHPISGWELDGERVHALAQPRIGVRVPVVLDSCTDGSAAIASTFTAGTAVFLSCRSPSAALGGAGVPGAGRCSAP